MEIKTHEDLTRTIISKQAIRNGLNERAEQLSNQLELTLHQIDDINRDINTLYKLQAKSPNDPETQDHPHAIHPYFTQDLEPANHPED